MGRPGELVFNYNEGYLNEEMAVESAKLEKEFAKLDPPLSLSVVFPTGSMKIKKGSKSYNTMQAADEEALESRAHGWDGTQSLI